MRPTLFRFACFASALLAVGLWVGRSPNRADADVPRIVLSNGAPSIEALVSSFLAALANNDRAAIEGLRIDEQEYRTLILPGSVKPGQPPQVMPDRKNEYFWRLANTKSIYSLLGIVDDYGGQRYHLKKIEIPRVDQFTWYIAHRDPVLHLETEEGSKLDLQLGSIAEHQGRFKFISYRSD